MHNMSYLKKKKKTDAYSKTARMVFMKRYSSVCIQISLVKGLNQEWQGFYVTTALNTYQGWRSCIEKATPCCPHICSFSPFVKSLCWLSWASLMSTLSCTRACEHRQSLNREAISHPCPVYSSFYKHPWGVHLLCIYIKRNILCISVYRELRSPAANCRYTSQLMHLHRG
jgi:hypothetical protein